MKRAKQINLKYSRKVIVNIKNKKKLNHDKFPRRRCRRRRHTSSHKSKKKGPMPEPNRRPLAPKARIIPLDQSGIHASFESLVRHPQDGIRLKIGKNLTGKSVSLLLVQA